MTSHKQISVNVHIFGMHASWAVDQVHFHLSKESECPSGFIPLYSGQVIIDAPSPAALAAATIKRLREEQEKIQAEAGKKTVELEGMIQNLLTLTYEEPAS